MSSWWWSRSSTPLPRNFVSGGKLDSHPLRQSLLNLPLKLALQTVFAGQDAEIVAALHAAIGRKQVETRRELQRCVRASHG